MTRSTCPYCGVGCGVVAVEDRIVGDPAHPANLGRLCSKGAALIETLGEAGRLTQPRIGDRRASWDAALGLIADRWAASIAEHGPDSVALYVSGQCLTEDYYVANKLMKGFVGSANIDTNSRLCMASSVAGHTRAFGADIVPGIYDDIDEADLVVLVGSNLAWCHPILYRRLEAARARRGTRVVVVDPRRTASCEAADLHLPIAPGGDVALFNALLVHLHDRGATNSGWLDAHTTGFDTALAAARADGHHVAEATGLSAASIDAFLAMFAATERVVTIYSQGVNQSSAGTDKVNAIINCHLATGRIGRPGMGPFSVTGQPNAMGGREVGGLANQLAAHMRLDDPAARDRVRRFWQAPVIAERPGLKAIELFDAARDGRIKALWIIATNPADSLPRSARVREALRACPFVVVSDCWATDTTALADLVLPAAGWGEKDGTVTNSERMISRQRAFRQPPGEARPDWQALAGVATRLGHGRAFAWPNAAAIFREHAALTEFENDGARPLDLGALADLSDAAYDLMEPTRWPAPRGAAPVARLFGDGRFPTPDGRARLVATPYRPAARAADPAFPLVLNTGRLRDQWHTMTRTGLSARLATHAPAAEATLAPADAAALGLVPGDLVRVTSPHGTIIVRGNVSDAQRRGDLFIPMHATDAVSAAGPVGRVVGAATDPLSGQPELKATPVRVTRIPITWRGLVLSREAPTLSEPGQWWSRIPIADGHATDLLGTVPLPKGPALGALAARLLGAGTAEQIELADPARGVWRFAVLDGPKVLSCLFLSAGDAPLPARDGLFAMFAASISPADRLPMLAGRAAVAGCSDRAVCACFSVGDAAIRSAIIAGHLTSVAQIGAALSAGTNCGSCIPELKEILRDVHADAA